MDLEIRNKSALILGGSAGLGLGAAKALVAEGVRVVLVGRDLEKARIASAELNGTAVSCDLANPVDVAGLVPRALQALGKIDILILNGGGPPPMPAAVFDAREWRSQFESIVLSLINVATHCLEGMRSRGFGRIILVSSTSIVEPIPGLVLSNALRAGLRGWAKTLASEVARDGVTVNILMPGRILTDRTLRLDMLEAQETGVEAAEVSRASQAEIPIGRYGTPDEFGALVAFLCSSRAAYITGTSIPVDGGLMRST
jgi:3-oxoacyl-[acyl-carrier protein] reductase